MLRFIQVSRVEHLELVHAKLSNSFEKIRHVLLRSGCNLSKLIAWTDITICWKGMCDMLIRFTLPGTMRLTNLSIA